MPNNLLLWLFLFLASVVVLGQTASILQKKLVQAAKALKVSEFFVGFFVLGFATSLPEFSVLLNSLFLQTTALSLGNLSGGIFVIFGLLLPLRAVIGRGLPFKGRFGVGELFLTLLYVSLPFLLITLSGPKPTTGLLLVLVYPLLIYLASRRHSPPAKFAAESLEMETQKIHWPKMFAGIVILLLLLFATADLTVNTARAIVQAFAVPSFLFGLTFLAIGTNLPELSLLLASLHSPSKSKVAVGDLLGSATVNVLLIGLLLLFSPPLNFPLAAFYLTAFSALLLLSLFFLFACHHQEVTLREGVALILFYLIFAMSGLVF